MGGTAPRVPVRPAAIKRGRFRCWIGQDADDALIHLHAWASLALASNSLRVFPCLLRVLRADLLLEHVEDLPWELCVAQQTFVHCCPFSSVHSCQRQRLRCLAPANLFARILHDFNEKGFRAGAQNPWCN